MQDLKVYSEKEEVLIKAEVTKRILSGNSVFYVLTDPKTGKEYHAQYTPDEVYPIPGKGDMKDDRNGKSRT